MNMPHYSRLIATTLAMATLACASSGTEGADLTVNRNPDVDFSGYRTFDFTGEGNVEGLSEERLDQMVAAIERALVEKGYQRSSSNPDFLVEGFGAFEGRMEEEEVKERYPSYFQRENEHTFTRDYTVVTNWEDGTLALHVLDGQSRDLIWSVTAEGAIQASENPNVMRERLEAGATELLADFPSR